MKKVLYKSIALRLLTDNTVKSIFTINGLPTDENKTTTVFPSAYIHFADIQYTPIGETSREINYRILLHIVFESFSDNAIRTINDIPNRINTEDETLKKIIDLLDNWTPEGADSAMVLEKEYQDTEHNTHSVWVQEYCVTYSNC